MRMPTAIRSAFSPLAVWVLVVQTTGQERAREFQASVSVNFPLAAS